MSSFTSLRTILPTTTPRTLFLLVPSGRLPSPEIKAHFGSEPFSIWVPKWQKTLPEMRSSQTVAENDHYFDSHLPTTSKTTRICVIVNNGEGMRAFFESLNRKTLQKFSSPEALWKEFCTILVTVFLDPTTMKIGYFIDYQPSVQFKDECAGI